MQHTEDLRAGIRWLIGYIFKTRRWYNKYGRVENLGRNLLTFSWDDLVVI